MSDVINFTDWQESHKLVISHQKFPTSHERRSLRISDEALEGLLKLADFFNCEGSEQKKLNALFEMLGLNTLQVIVPQEYKHPDGYTTKDCEEEGRQDAREKREYNFKLLFPTAPREFEEAYRRGFLQLKEIDLEK